MGNKGLYEKYRVERLDGKPIKWCFVLEPENDEAAREALITYAVYTSDVALHDDLLNWLAERGWCLAEDG